MKHIMIAVCFLLGISLHAQTGSLKALDINLTNYQYPFPVQYTHISTQEQALQMAYMDVQPSVPNNGKAVLLLHGKNFNGAYWAETAKALAAKGYRVIIPDQVGFGKSSKPLHFQYTFQQLAGNTKVLVDSLKVDKLVVVGHSMGGMLATRFALMYPSTVSKLVLVNPIGLEDWKTIVPYVDIDGQYKKELAQNYASLKQYQQENYYHGTWKPAYDQWLNLLAGWTLDKDYPTIAWNSALTADMIFTQPVCYEFGNIVQPTLLIIGQADRTAIGKDAASPEAKKKLGNYPLLGKWAQQQIKHSTLVELSGVGHLPHIESFERFIKPLLDFIK